MIKKFVFIAFVVLSFLFTGCGLDNFYYLDMPLAGDHTAQVSSSDPITNYFTCLTNEQSSSNSEYFNSSSELAFLGTEIYYKIYDNLSTMQNVEQTVDGMVSSTNYTSATEYLISNKYQPLKLDRGSFSPLIRSGSSPQNRYVYIRLSDYQANTEYRRGICIGNSRIERWSDALSVKVDGVNVIPTRSNEYGGFNFSRSDSSNPVPVADDLDTNFTQTSGDTETLYVDMYAVSIGRDVSYVEFYSQPLFMGAVTIKVLD